MILCNFFLSICISVIHSLINLAFIISDIRNWIRNIEQHASDNVNKILVGNKADMDESKRVRYNHIIILFINFCCSLDFSNIRLGYLTGFAIIGFSLN